MPRLQPPSLEQMTPEQRAVHDDIVSGPRGKLQGPLAVWLTSPELADKAQRLGRFCRFETSLPPQLSELAILVTGRVWGAEFEWWAHKRIGIEAGLDPQLVEAVRQRRVPEFAGDDQRIVYDVATQLHRDHRISDRTYSEAVELLGETGVVELVGILGYYTLISMTLNAFQVPLPAGAEPELD